MKYLFVFVMLVLCVGIVFLGVSLSSSNDEEFSLLALETMMDIKGKECTIDKTPWYQNYYCGSVPVECGDGCPFTNDRPTCKILIILIHIVHSGHLQAVQHKRRLIKELQC